MILHGDGNRLEDLRDLKGKIILRKLMKVVSNECLKEIRIAYYQAESASYQAEVVNHCFRIQNP